MNWSNVNLILRREVRDQLRDRRTLFMIFILPLLLYPLLGMSMFQVAQFVREHAVKVLLVGATRLPDSPPLLAGQGFAPGWFARPEDARLLEVERSPHEPEQNEAAMAAFAQPLLDQGRYELVVYFPPDFTERLEAFRQGLRQPTQERRPLDVPGPEIFHNTAKEKSKIAYLRVADILRGWREAIAREQLAQHQVDVRAVQPFEIRPVDLADARHREAAVWSKIFPFLVLIWALTGAFYPAVDLCAGEKERGTLETLLSSPAERSEIVWGKLLTVMLFSAATVVFNVLSMALTGAFVLSQFPQFGLPPLGALVWLFVVIPPVSALFSALCLALAAFARSSKEGQYYLMPLVMITLPLVMLPMAPGVELNLGNSLIPVTGIVLLLRAVIEGNAWQALPYVAPVTVVTLGCCLAAIRWAIDQFNSEAVLFRESERLDLGLRLRRMFRDRRSTPTASQALFCAIVILLLKFFLSFLLPMPSSFRDFALLAIATQLVVVLAPALVLTLLLTRSPARTLLLSRPRPAHLVSALTLAVALHPAVNLLQQGVMRLYPVSDRVAEELSRLLKDPGHPLAMFLVIALLPAVCEELAFRGFILSGWRHLGHRWRAILYSSIAFGLTHAIFQQSIVASLVGCILGYLAVQTGSLWPGVLFHMMHNGLALLAAQVHADTLERYPALGWLYWHVDEQGFSYQPLVVAGLSLIALVLLRRLSRLPFVRTPEESLQEAIDHGAPQAVHSWAGW